MENELPLADVTAYVTSQRAGKGNNSYFINVQIGAGEALHQRADQSQIDAFLRGPSGHKLVRLMFFPLPEDWEPVVNPDQGDETVESLEERLVELWDKRLQMMTDASP